MNLWRNFSQFFIFHTVRLISAKTFAAAPLSQGWEEHCKKASKKMEGPELAVKWSKKFQPQAVGWIGAFQGIKVPAKAASIAIERTGIGKIPSKLLVVPKDTSLQPKVLDIAENQKKLNFSTTKIQPNKIWLWGNTPKSPCEDGCMNKQAYEINISYHGKFISSENGVFVLTLNKSLHQHPLSFFSAGGPETATGNALRHISIDGFQPIIKNVLQPKRESWGKSYEVKVKFYDSTLISCPLY